MRFARLNSKSLNIIVLDVILDKILFTKNNDSHGAVMETTVTEWRQKNKSKGNLCFSPVSPIRGETRSKPVALLGLLLLQLVRPKYFDVSFFKSFLDRNRAFCAHKSLPLLIVKKLRIDLEVEALSPLSRREINNFDEIDFNPLAIVYSLEISTTKDDRLSIGV